MEKNICCQALNSFFASCTAHIIAAYQCLQKGIYVAELAKIFLSPEVNSIFGMKVEIGTVFVDTLQAMSGVLIAKAMGIPKKLAQIVIMFQDKDLC